MRYWGTEHSRKKKRGAKRTPRLVSSGGSIKEAPFLRRFYRHQAEISEGVQKFIFFVILSALVYVFLLSDNGIIRIISLERQKARLQRSIAEATAMVEEMEEEVDHLKHDPFYMEKLGRRYGYIYQGERVYKIVPGLDRTPAKER